MQISRPQSTSLRDILAMGGASVVAFLVIRSMDITVADYALLAGVMFIAAHFVNHPHFAHSYQLFYGQLKAMSMSAPSRVECLKIWWAAYLAPAVLAILLLAAAWAWREGNDLPLGVMINAMGALVGWHYVKQGFGMAMTDAALKKTYWSPLARRWLLINAYLCWILTWTYLNTSDVGAQFWGIFYQRLNLPKELVVGLALLALFSTLRVVLLIYRDLKRHQAAGVDRIALPWAGLMGYGVSLYLWTIFATIDPAFLLLIPFFHSLQYLTVVYRCKSNELRHTQVWQVRLTRLFRFFAVGVVAGVLAFWVVPGMIDFQKFQLMWTDISEPAIAIATFWIFINVHHYFIDNVLWRASNPYIKQNLFGQGEDRLAAVN